MSEQILALPVLNKLHVSFHIYARTKGLFDVGNVASIHEKFFLDALVELGRLEDDNLKFIPTTDTAFMGVDKLNPRVEIILKEIK